MGVPGAGLHRSRRSGRGRPTAFLIVSVTKRVSAWLEELSAGIWKGGDERCTL